MNRFRICLVLALLSESTTASDAAQIVYYAKSWTGAELAADPSVDFPTQPPVILGDDIQWNDGTNPASLFFEIPLVPADTIPADQAFFVRVEFEMLRRTASFSPSLTLSRKRDSQQYGYDGTAFHISGSRPAGRILARSIWDNDADGVAEGYIESQIYPFEIATPSPPHVVTGRAYWRSSSSASAYGLRIEGGAEGQANFPYRILDPALPLYFGFWLLPTDENSNLRSLAITVAAVPEPGGVFAAGQALIALGAMRRRGGRREIARFSRRVFWRFVGSRRVINATERNAN